MDIITVIIYLVLFIIMMVFVFSIGMLKQYMPKREVLLVIAVAFFIGSIGGAFFLQPIYEELPDMASTIEKNMPNNEEKLSLDLSSSVDTDALKKDVSSMNGFKSFNETSVSIPMWHFNKMEHDYFEDIVGNIDSNYKNYTVAEDKIIIELADNYTASQALKTFSDWYKLVYGETLSYAQIHAVLVVDSTHFDEFKQVLLNKGIVASNIEGPIQNSVNATNSSMLSNLEFTLVCGSIGVVVALIGIYMDTVVPAYRRFRKSMNKKRKR